MTEKLALNGGDPASPRKIPIAKPVFTEEAIEQVSEVIRSGYLRQGPKTKQFEELFADFVGSKYAYANSNGTAALHLAYLSLLNHGDEVIVPGYTFIASISSIVYARAIPVLAEIDESLNLDPEDVRKKITPRTKAIMAVHMLGNPAKLDALEQIAEEHNLFLIEDEDLFHLPNENQKVHHACFQFQRHVFDLFVQLLEL